MCSILQKRGIIMLFSEWLDNGPKVTLWCAVISGISLVLSITGALGSALPFDIAWVAIILCGVPIVVGAVRGLIVDHDVTADVLVAMALLASLYVREYFAAGEVALIMQIGSLLEDFTSDRARKGIEKLIKLTPRTARVVTDGKAKVVPAEEVAVGDILEVLAGETIPVDGRVVSGETAVDQSVMTGESIPVDKGAGDEVISGTVNQYGTFTMRAEKVCQDSSLQRMITLAEEADAEKAPIVKKADRWAAWLVFIALATALITWAATGEFIRGVTVLVVFCPCAFVLATPTAVMAGIASASRYGIIIRSGDSLERLSQITRAAFDKTGTITVGKPAVSEIRAYGGQKKDDVLALAAAAESKSEHPLGKAIAAAGKEKNLTLSEVGKFKLFAGKGVKAVIDGRKVFVGKPAWLKELGVDLSEAEEDIEGFLNQGATAIAAASEGKLLGVIALADRIRDDAPETIARLKAEGVEPMLLTGDNEAAARHIAAQAGIDDVRADLLPEDKLSMIREMEKKGEKICMTGDGVNDALALGAAHAGIAMGGIGSDIAVESADAVLVSDEIHRLPYLFSLTKKVIDKITQNIVFSLIINFTAILLSVTGVLNPVTGALFHNCGSVFVVVNAALLLRSRDVEEGPAEKGSAPPAVAKSVS